ncbi:MAG TPA: prepilin-type N-terminal cleavage/methylation domain-containing protein [Verrucomicrobiae bacterium]|nr:prepilin-type N-terminal cleavage/methylation domain-containing protein [Verrucomicrobiae bacterium]
MRKLAEKGFTLVEVLIISPIMIITVVMTMSFLFNQYGQLTQQGAQVNLNVDSQNITFSMQDDIFYANAFKQGLNSGLVDGHQPGGGWTYNSTPATLIVSAPALTGNRRAANRQPVYINTEGCDASVIEDNSPLYNNIIYFVSGTNLYKRTVSAPSSMATCGTSFQRQSCPQAQSSSSCPADRLLTDKLQSMTLTYYDTSNIVVTNPETAEKIQITLTLKDRAFAEDITATSSITLRKLNQ